MKLGLAVASTPAILIIGLYLLGQNTLAGLLLIAVVPLDVASAFVLTRASRRDPGLVALRERSVASVVGSIAAVCIGIFAANVIFAWHLPQAFTGLLFVAAISVISVPAIYWLWIYITKEF